jgi:ADP-ribosyl-[dinitrogen reductase] hydrolase
MNSFSFYINKMNSNEILERTIGIALGTAIGDAKGIAFETLTKQQIIDLQNKNEKTLYTRVTNHPYITSDWQIGRWTDDTQLTLAMMRAITNYLQSKEDFMSKIVQEHIIEWKESVAGWGGTKNAIERLSNGTHTYHNSGNKAEGNGVLMKLAPLAFYYSLCQNVNDDQIEIICRMTHDSSVALSTACIYVHMCIYLFEKKNLTSNDFLQYVYELSLKYERKYQISEEKYLVSLRIKRYLDSNSEINEKLIIDVSNGGTFYCVDSLTMIIGLIACIPTCQPSFETLIHATEIGGDTDSNAAMIGAIIGGMQGVKSLDEEHINQVYRNDYVRKIGEEFGLAIIEYLRDHKEKM